MFVQQVRLSPVAAGQRRHQQVAGGQQGAGAQHDGAGDTLTSILTSHWSGDLNTDLWLLQAAHIPNTDNDFQQFVLSNAR